MEPTVYFPFSDYFSQAYGDDWINDLIKHLFNERVS